MSAIVSASDNPPGIGTGGPPTLPEEILQHFGGHQLEQKVGETVLFCAVGDDSWPQLAILSVGEILAISATELRLMFNRTSRTAQGLSQSGRGLMVVVLNGAIYKIRLACQLVAQPSETRATRAVFAGIVDDVRVDEVDYAEVTNGLQFRLPNQPEVISRWENQVRILRGTDSL